VEYFPLSERRSPGGDEEGVQKTRLTMNSRNSGPNRKHGLQETSEGDVETLRLGGREKLIQEFTRGNAESNGTGSTGSTNNEVGGISLNAQTSTTLRNVVATIVAKTIIESTMGQTSSTMGAGVGTEVFKAGLVTTDGMGSYFIIEYGRNAGVIRI
jgi:hypothetical protein